MLSFDLTYFCNALDLLHFCQFFNSTISGWYSFRKEEGTKVYHANVLDSVASRLKSFSHSAIQVSFVWWVKDPDWTMNIVLQNHCFIFSFWYQNNGNSKKRLHTLALWESTTMFLFKSSCLKFLFMWPPSKMFRQFTYIHQSLHRLSVRMCSSTHFKLTGNWQLQKPIEIGKQKHTHNW